MYELRLARSARKELEALPDPLLARVARQLDALQSTPRPPGCKKLRRRNRFYDGATGQFNQQDPIGLAGGANTYGFVGGDPVNYSDPLGLCNPMPWCARGRRSWRA